MVNMNVGYVRSCYSLQQLQTEIQRTFPGREQNKGFISGYRDGARGGALSGHYPDHNGITYAYDIGVDIEGDGSGLLLRDAEWLFDYLESQQNARFQYAIYNTRITGNHTGWDMDPYIGLSPHKDHIHISVVDLQWGEPSGVSTAVTDSRASWGVYEAYHGKVLPAEAAAPKPIKEPDLLEEIMALNRNTEDYRHLVDDIGEAVWDERMSGEGEPHWQARTHLIRAGRGLERIEAQNHALTQALASLSTDPAITPKALEAMLQKAVADFRVTLAPEPK